MWRACLAIVIAACGSSIPAPQAAPRTPSVAETSPWDHPPVARDPGIEERLWPHMMTLDGWRPTWLGLAPKSRVEYVGIDCLLDETATPPRSVCTAATTSPTLQWWRKRLGQCFVVADVAPRRAVLDAIAATWKRSPNTGGPPALDAHRAPGRFVAVKLVRRLRQPTYHNTCGDGPQNPDQPICTPGPGPRTGTTIVDAQVETVLVPSGIDPPIARLPTPFDPPQRFRVAWVFIGTWQHGKFVADPALETMVGNEHGGGGVSDPKRALAALERQPLTGTPERRAAILVDRAVAAYRLGELAKAQRATKQLRELAAVEPIDQKSLALDMTLASLVDATSGAWLLADPCVP